MTRCDKTVYLFDGMLDLYKEQHAQNDMDLLAAAALLEILAYNGRSLGFVFNIMCLRGNEHILNKRLNG